MTRERAKELLPVIQAFAEGKEVQYMDRRGVWRDDPNSNFDPQWDYRIKPEPRLRPWRPEEVPVVALMRTKGNKTIRPWVILGTTLRGTVQFPGDDNEIHGDTFEQCLALREWSSDRPGTPADKINWQPCGVITEDPT